MLNNVLARESFDVLVCHAPWTQAIFGPVARSIGLPLIFWMHGPTNGRHWTERWAHRTPPDLVLCNSRFTASTLSNLYPSVRAEVVYYPVACPQSNYVPSGRSAVRAEIDTPENATVIIQVSRMEALKGHVLHLQALSKLSDMSGWICWVVGGAQQDIEKSYCAELQSLAACLGISERVRFIGERSDVARLVNAADIYCQPNIQPEAFGIAFIEALEAKLPIVTTAMGGACEIVNDLCGILVPPGDADRLTSALRGLIVDRTRRGALGEAGPARARELCDATRQLERLYELTGSVLQYSAHV